jgi:hypothetical protein
MISPHVFMKSLYLGPVNPTCFWIYLDSNKNAFEIPASTRDKSPAALNFLDMAGGSKLDLNQFQLALHPRKNGIGIGFS